MMVSNDDVWPQKVEWPQLLTECELAPGTEYAGIHMEARRYAAKLPGDGQVSVLVHLLDNETARARAELVKNNHNGSVQVVAEGVGADVASAVRFALRSLDLKMRSLAMELSYRS